jgi:hypothetical protein
MSFDFDGNTDGNVGARRQITADQTEKLPEPSREMIRRAVDEYESRQSAEALCA